MESTSARAGARSVHCPRLPRARRSPHGLKSSISTRRMMQRGIDHHFLDARVALSELINGSPSAHRDK